MVLGKRLGNELLDVASLGDDLQILLVLELLSALVETPVMTRGFAESADQPR